MPRFDIMGLDSLVLDTKELADLPDNIIFDMLEAGGNVIKAAHEAALSTLFGSPTFPGLVTHLKNSINVFHRKDGREKYVLIYPKGSHHTYKSKKGGTKTSTTGEVAFIHEYGGHGNEATQWMRKTNEQNVSKAVDAEYKVYDDWLKSHNL